MTEFTRPTLRLIPLLACVLTFFACDRSAPSASEAPAVASRPSIVCTVAMVADTVREVAGPHAEVTALMGPGIDPHLYKPTRSDIAKLTVADAVFYNGLLLEGKMTDALVRIASTGKRVRAVASEVPESQLLQPDGMEGHEDPHVWMDPRRWGNAVEAVRRELGALVPAAKSDIDARAAAYAERLKALDAYAEKVLSSVPEKSRVLVTAHDAFAYLGDRYGFEVVGIQGISTESEAGVRDIERIVALLVERKIGAVFIESTIAPRSVQALIEGAKARGHTVTIGGELFSDAMGQEGTYEGTYIGMIDHNVTTIARALGGTAPQGGMSGKLSNFIDREKPDGEAR